MRLPRNANPFLSLGACMVLLPLFMLIIAILGTRSPARVTSSPLATTPLSNAPQPSSFTFTGLELAQKILQFLSLAEQHKLSDGRYPSSFLCETATGKCEVNPSAEYWFGGGANYSLAYLRYFRATGDSVYFQKGEAALFEGLDACAQQKEELDKLCYTLFLPLRIFSAVTQKPIYATKAVLLKSSLDSALARITEDSAAALFTVGRAFDYFILTGDATYRDEALRLYGTLSRANDNNKVLYIHQGREVRENDCERVILLLRFAATLDDEKYANEAQALLDPLDLLNHREYFKKSQEYMGCIEANIAPSRTQTLSNPRYREIAVSATKDLIGSFMIYGDGTPQENDFGVIADVESRNAPRVMKEVFTNAWIASVLAFAMPHEVFTIPKKSAPTGGF